MSRRETAREGKRILLVRLLNNSSGRGLVRAARRELLDYFAPVPVTHKPSTSRGLSLLQVATRVATIGVNCVHANYN